MTASCQASHLFGCLISKLLTCQNSKTFTAIKIFMRNSIISWLNLTVKGCNVLRIPDEDTVLSNLLGNVIHAIHVFTQLSSRVSAKIQTSIRIVVKKAVSDFDCAVTGFSYFGNCCSDGIFTHNRHKVLRERCKKGKKLVKKNAVLMAQDIKEWLGCLEIENQQKLK